MRETENLSGKKVIVKETRTKVSMMGVWVIVEETGKLPLLKRDSRDARLAATPCTIADLVELRKLIDSVVVSES